LIFDSKKFALNTLLPHAFVSHDMEHHPIDKWFNSSKSSKKLPSMKNISTVFNLQKWPLK
jgi:hypothetical protein